MSIAATRHASGPRNDRSQSVPPRAGRLSSAYLAGVCAVVLGSALLPVPASVDGLTRSLVGVSVVVAVLVGVRTYRPRTRLPWYLIAAGQAMWVLADTIAPRHDDALRIGTFPSAADLLCLAGYPTFAAALALLVRHRNRSRRDPGPVLDSAVVTAGLCLLSWVLLVRPTIEANHSIGTALVAAAYPMMGIVLVGGLVRLVSAPGGGSPAFRLLLLALVLLIGADTLSVAFDLYASAEAAAVDVLWMLSAAAWGASALHPSMGELTRPLTGVQIRFRGFRLLGVVLATLIAPTILAVHQVTGVAIDVWAVIIGSVVMFLLVVIRMNLALAQIGNAHEALETLQDELAIQATHDPLTGLLNRTQSMRLIAGALGRARRRETTVGLLFIDLDGFKEVNDTHGHRAGDDVLRQVAARMKEVVRENDFVARLGGDEFLVGIEDVEDEHGPVVLGDRLIEAISEEVQTVDGLTLRVGASVGIALGRGGETDVETLLHEADLAVYRAKGAGRGCTVLFNGTARAALKLHTDVERALVAALAADEMVLHYQPIIDVASGTIEGYEALVRWDRPGVGLLAPSEFLPVAESTDLVCELDVWVLRAAAEQLARWNWQRGDTALQVCVNVSGRHISQARVQRDVAEVLADVAIEPGQLVVEVTETALMDGDAAAANLDALRSFGVVVSLDDFGTGYQSSTQLSRLPIDVVKIDRCFVDDIDSTSARSLLELMIMSAHAFGAKVVVEGIERPEQLELARDLGSEYVQGFYFGAPVPADQVHAQVRDGLLAG